MKHFYLLCALLIPSLTFGQSLSWDQLVSQFVDDYESLNIAGVNLSYIDNLNRIRSKEEVSKQWQVFESLENQLKKYDRIQLNLDQQLEFDLLNYYLRLNKKRIQLEQAWNEQGLTEIPENGIFYLPNGKEWYVYFLQRWVDLEVDIEDLYKFGMKEIKKVKSKISAIQKRSGKKKKDFNTYILSDEFLYYDPEEVQLAFEEYAIQVRDKIQPFFPKIREIAPAKIERGTNTRLAQVPGFYSRNTFFYNIFDKPFNRRQVAMLYAHEAEPGHHYEVSYQRLNRSIALARLINNPSYSEGWAAYIEDLGFEIGLYRDIYDELGKWEWDLIRSVRVPLDIGLNYYGWSDKEALAFWQKFIEGQDDIAQREIARMKRWPCQVITYKYGATKIMEWKKKMQQKENFSLLAFHTQFLENGRLPISILERYFFDG